MITDGDTNEFAKEFTTWYVATLPYGAYKIMTPFSHRFYFVFTPLSGKPSGYFRMIRDTEIAAPWSTEIAVRCPTAANHTDRVSAACVKAQTAACAAGGVQAAYDQVWADALAIGHAQTPAQCAASRHTCPDGNPPWSCCDVAYNWTAYERTSPRTRCGASTRRPSSPRRPSTGARRTTAARWWCCSRSRRRSCAGTGRSAASCREGQARATTTK